VITVVVGNVVNAALAIVVVFGVPAIGIPSMGVIGAGLATVFVQIMMLAMFVVAVRRLEASTPGPRERATRADMREIVRYGLPVGGHVFAEVSIFSLATVLAASIGKVSAAAHTIVLNTASLSFACTVGIASATSVRVGLAVGAQNIELARRRGLLGLGMGAILMATSALVFFVAPRLIASLFTNDGAVTAMTVTLLRIVPLFQLSDGTQSIAAGALRGLGTTRVTFVGNVIGHYVVGLPLMIVLAFTLDLGARGLWIALSAGLTATAAILAISFLRNTSRSRR
jgi:multidrug resistance protein, MATE family